MRRTLPALVSHVSGAEEFTGGRGGAASVVCALLPASRDEDAALAAGAK